MARKTKTAEEQVRARTGAKVRGKKVAQYGRRTRDNWNRISTYLARQAAEGDINLAECARELKINPQIVRDAWHKGWAGKNRPWCAVPLKDQHQLATNVARARIETDRIRAEQQKALIEQQAIQNAAKAHAEEGQLVRAVRGSAAGLLKQAVRLVSASQPLTEALAGELVRLAKADKVDVNVSLRIVRELGRHASQCAGLVETAMELERKHLGRPERILGLTGEGERMSLEEALRMLAGDEETREQVGTYMRQRLEQAHDETSIIDVTPLEGSDDVTG